MKAEHTYILNSFVHGIAQGAALSIGISGVVDMVKKDADGKRHPVMGAIRTLIGAGMAYATEISAQNTNLLLIKECEKEFADEAGVTETEAFVKADAALQNHLRMQDEIRKQQELIKKRLNKMRGIEDEVPVSTEEPPKTLDNDDLWL